MSALALLQHAVQDGSITTEQWLRFGGRLHPVVLHLPIGLWAGIAVLEFGGFVIRRQAPRATLAVLAWLAAITAALAAASGWLLADEGGYSAPDLDQHRWLGVASAAASLLGALFAGLRGRAPFRLLLLVVLGTMLPAAHFGGSLTHGKHFLTEPFRPPRPPAPASQQDPTQPDAADPPAALTYENTIAPLLQRYCVSCHGEEKQKGDLMLHTIAGIRDGGMIEPVLVPGEPDRSPLLLHCELPLEHEDHMPPEGKPQPTPVEVQLLRAWITAGAPFEGAFAAGAAGGVAQAAPAGGGNTAAPAGGGITAAPAEGGNTAAPAEGGATARPQRGPDEADLQQLRAHFVHAAPLREGDALLVVDTAAAGPSFTDASARASLLAVAPFVHELGLARSGIGDATMQLCAQMPALRRLDLRSTRITSAGVALLRSLPALEELVLVGCPVDDAVVPALLAMPALRRVYLWRTGVSAPAIERLRQRGDLVVDAGDTEEADPLATEGELRLVDELPLPGEDPLLRAQRQWARPVNDICPVAFRPVDPRFLIVHDGRTVGFCCADCPRQFWADPAKFPVAPR